MGPTSKRIQRNVKGHYRTSFGQKKSKFYFMDGDFRTALVYIHMYNCNGELRKPIIECHCDKDALITLKI